jgi:hypothetical protein
MTRTDARRPRRTGSRSASRHRATSFRQLAGLTAGITLVVLALAIPASESSAEDDGDRYEGNGVQVRVGHIEGQGVPEVMSLTPVEIFPYMLMEDSLLFTDLRFLTTNDLTFGGNIGAGYRYYSESLDRVFGISTWYDADNTRRLYFQQVGVSLDTYAGLFDARTNVYIPVGPTYRQSALDVVGGSTQFVGNNLIYNQVRSWFAAMKGFDMEVGIPIPGEFANDHGIRIYGGGYYYTDDQGNTIGGGSGRVLANIFSGLDAQVQVTHDSFFGTRAFAGVSWTFGDLHRSQFPQKSAYGRIGEHIIRNYTVVAPERSQLEHRTAVDPATGAPYTFAHVDSAAAPGGTGSITSPFQTISAAQLAGRNIIFVHAGSVFASPASLVLTPGERILGDGPGVQNIVQVPEIGGLLLPHAGSGALPVLNGSLGDAVVLANNSEFSGFSITNAAGNAILGNGVQNVTLNNISINQPAGDGIRLINAGGTIAISNALIANAGASGIDIQGELGQVQFLGTTHVSNSTVSGIFIQGGSGLVQFGGPTFVSNSTGTSVAISNLASTSNVNFTDLSIDHRQGVGMAIDNSAGAVTVTGTTNISNESGATASGLTVTNSSGVGNFNGVNVSGATGSPAVDLVNDPGTVSFRTLNISSANGTALHGDTVANLVINAAVNNQVDTTQGGTINAVNGTAVDIQSSGVNINLTSVSSSNAAGDGIRLVNTPGLFAVFGGSTIGSGGTIQGAGTGIFLQNTGLVGFQWMTINSNGTGIRADTVNNLVISNTAITNSTSFGIDLLNTPTLSVSGSTFSGNGGANIHAQFSQLGSYAYSISNTQLTSTTADNIALAVLSGGQGSTMNLTVQGDAFSNSLTGTNAVNLNWNGGLSASFNQTTFAVSGGSSTGVLINNASTSALSTIAMTNTSFSGSGTFDTDLHVVTAGTSQINVVNNLAQFAASNGTGFEFSLVNPTVNIASNTITNSTDGTTGILFDSITGPGSVTINDNLIQLTNQGVLLDRGIIFTNVTNTIQLFGTQDDTVQNAGTPFFAPFGTTTGSILVNGSRVP